MQPNKPNPNHSPNNQSIMNPRMEAGAYLSLTSSMDLAIRTEQIQNNNAVCATWSGEATNTPGDADWNDINSQAAGLSGPTLEEIMEFEEYLAATGNIERPHASPETRVRCGCCFCIKHRQQQGIILSSETLVGDPSTPQHVFLDLHKKQMCWKSCVEAKEVLATCECFDGKFKYPINDSNPATIYASTTVSDTQRRESIEQYIKYFCCESCVAAARALATCECCDEGSSLKRPRNDSNSGTTDSSTTASFR